MTGKLTAKQAAAHMRKHLKAPGSVWTWTNPSGEKFELRVPAGVHLAVRATRSGVNVTIEDRGYVDAVTGGDRRAWRPELGEPVVEMVRDYQRFIFGEEIGEVKWGAIFIFSEGTTA
jgi:hypothetical protein